MAHLRHIFSRLLLAEKLDVHPVHLAFFAIAGKKICTESVPPHSISVSLDKNLPCVKGVTSAKRDGGIVLSAGASPRPTTDDRRQTTDDRRQTTDPDHFALS